ncbi:TetR/AcrR family transcriptional regulator [Oceanispirochaeta sp.]|jgi:TetR/AcrR family transcriptional regulator|uniref:TetR/AcrR family transcriptional regulator n=1 Tax=Oceanispirochaeta sp. TaxID=2035350 RepID=UPI002621937B|nr:TetR/AcrR family transcriptional regulator [Oceanispirochaeta sp.]MDA3957394.1 TetR/AcrR family transcriptional regulator [Oceanispirochaeta sp.]
MSQKEKDLESSSDKIMKAALDVIAREKISGLRMRQISEEAGMSQGILHYYFHTKKELLSRLLDFILLLFQKERNSDFASSDGSPAGKIHAFFQEKKRSILEKKMEYIQFDFWVQGTMDTDLKEKIQKSYLNWRYNLYEVIQEGVVSGEFKADRAVGVDAMIVSLLMGGSVQYLIDESAFELDQYLNQAESMVLGYLKGTTGLP